MMAVAGRTVLAEQFGALRLRIGAEHRERARRRNAGRRAGQLDGPLGLGLGVGDGGQIVLRVLGLPLWSARSASAVSTPAPTSSANVHTTLKRCPSSQRPMNGIRNSDSITSPGTTIAPTIGGNTSRYLSSWNRNRK